MAQAKAYIVGTLDTKGEELLYLGDLLAADGVQACIVDVSTSDAAQLLRCNVDRHNWSV